MLEASIGPLGRAGADDGVELVDEEDDLPGGVGDFLEHRLEPLLELAAVLGAGDQRAHVERDDLLVLEPFGHVLADDPLRQPFDDGRLADARLADEHRVVLGAAREHLDHPADLVVAADDRIELALARQLGQVAAVALERLVGRLRVLAGHALRAADRGERLEDGVAGDAARLEQPRRRRPPALGRDRDQQVLGADVLVLEPLRFRFGGVGDLPQPRRQRDLRAAVRARQLVELGADRGRQRRRIRVHLADDLRDDAVALLEQRQQQVLGVISGWPSRSASCCALRTASWAFSVYLLMFIVVSWTASGPSS